MPFFSKHELSPVERFKSALKDKQAAREKLADRMSAAEAALGEKRSAAERLATAGAADARLDRAEAAMRAAEDRAEILRAALAQLDEQIVTIERELADAKAQRDRDIVARELETIAALIEQAAPSYDAAAVALVDVVTKSAASMPEATNFATHLDAVRREVDSATALLCSELRATAARARAGNANIAIHAPPEPKPPPPLEIERHLIYTLDPLLWREAGEVRRVSAFAQVGLPKTLLAVALRHQHVDYLNARRVQNLMQIYGSGQSHSAPHADDPRLVDLDALAAKEVQKSAQADAA
ncbi:MAG: hypothetical protein ACXWCY_33445 [Burkholderiales bacterium]